MSNNLGFDLEEAMHRRGDRITVKNIEALRVSLTDSKNVPASITDKFLALFLSVSDGKVDVAKNTCETYFDARRHAPEHFTLRDPMCEEVQQCLENQHYFILPFKDGCPIIFHQVSNSKPTNYHFDHAIKTFFMLIDICLHRYGPQRGIIFLFDMRYVRIGHMMRTRVSSLKKYFRYVQEGLPASLYQIHVINVVSFFDKILTLIKPFMRAEIFKVLHTHSASCNMDDFYEKYISRECLPSDFGGDLASCEELHEQFKNEFYKLREYFRAEEEQRGSFWNEIVKDKKGRKQQEIVQNFSKLDID